MSERASRIRSTLLLGFFLGVALFVLLALMFEAGLDEQLRTLVISIVAGIAVAAVVAALRAWERRRASGQHEASRRINLGQSAPRTLPRGDEAARPRKKRARRSGSA